jgi:hypothetical protein
MAFTDILPDPTHPINAAGQGLLGVVGPGYAGVKLSSVEPVMKNLHNSQKRGRDLGYHHKWQIGITYNSLTCEQFHRIFAFVCYRNVSLKPFLVSVPPYEAQVVPGITCDGASKKASVVLVTGTGVLQGNIFNIAGSTKIYMVTRVETTTDYEGIPPGAGKERLHITPALHEDVTAATIFNFTDPLFRVVQTGDTASYQLTKDGLFNYSLTLEEVVNYVS